MHTSFREAYLGELSPSTILCKYYPEAPEVWRIPVEGFAGGRIESEQPPCESASSPAQNSGKTTHI